MNVASTPNMPNMPKVDNLSSKSLIAIDKFSRAMTESEALFTIDQLNSEWRLVKYKDILKLESAFELSDYDDSCKFVGVVSRLCRESGYAPDMSFGEDYVFITLFTPFLRGVHENDFIIAAKIDDLLAK